MADGSDRGRNPFGFDINIRLDQDQYRTIVGNQAKILQGIKTLQDLFVASQDDPKKLAALTAQLKTANDALSAVVAQNQPQP